MSKASRLITAAIAVTAIVAVLAIAGCTAPQTTVTPTPTPTPAPTATPVPTVTAAPGNQTAERQYQYVERFQSGIDHYNSGITLMWEANNTSVAKDYINASKQMLSAKGEMDLAIQDFNAMSQYAGNDKEKSLSEKWGEAANYESVSFKTASDAFAEYAYEYSRPNPNLIRANYNLTQANYYSNLALDSRKEADAIQSTIVFMVPTATP